MMKAKKEKPDVKESAPSETSREEEEYRHNFEEQFDESKGNDEIAARRQNVLDALGALFTTSEDNNFCILCGGADHAHHDCENP